MEIEYDDDFDSVEMCQSADLTGTDFDESNLDESPASSRSFGAARRSLPRPGATSQSPAKSPHVTGANGLLRVGTPGLAVSRASSTRADVDDDDELDDLIDEERDDVEHTLLFRSGLGGGSVNAPSKSKSCSGFTVKTFREIRGSARRQFDGSCVLLGVGLDGGGQAFAVQRFPLANEDVGYSGAGISDRGHLAPSVVRQLRARFQALSKLPAHPHVLAAHGATVKDGAVFCASTFAPGGSLVEAVSRETGEGRDVLAVPESVARLAILHTLRGLRHLHTNGVSHGAVHVRNLFIDTVASASTSGRPLDDDDDDEEAVRGLALALGGFAEAVVGGKAANPEAAPFDAKESPQPSRGGPLSASDATEGSGTTEPLLTWGQRVQPPDALRGVDESRGHFSPARRGRQHINGKGGAAGLGSGSSSALEPDGVEAFEDTSMSLSRLDNGAAADAEATAQAFVEDLQGLGRLFNALFHGFTHTGDTVDVTVDDASMSASMDKSGGFGNSLSAAAAEFQRSIRDAVLTGSMALTAAARRRDGAASKKAAIAASVERIDALLAEPFLEPADVANDLAADCRVRIPPIRRKAQPAPARQRPLPLALVKHTRETRRVVALECLKERSGGRDSSHMSFRFGSMRTGVSRSRSPSRGRHDVPAISIGGGNPRVQARGLDAGAVVTARSFNPSNQASSPLSGPPSGNIPGKRGPPVTARRTMAVL